MKIKKILVVATLLGASFGFSPIAWSAGGAFIQQSFVGEFGGTYYDFSIWSADPNHLDLNTPALMNTTNMPWIGSGNSGANSESAWLGAALGYSGSLSNSNWTSGNSGASIYALDTHNPDTSSVYSYSGGVYSRSDISSALASYYMTATAVTGGATPINNAALNGYILPTASLTYSAGPSGAPEIDGSLAPKVGFLLGCLFLMFGRKKQNTEQMMTA